MAAVGVKHPLDGREDGRYGFGAGVGRGAMMVQQQQQHQLPLKRYWKEYMRGKFPDLCTGQTAYHAVRVAELTSPLRAVQRATEPCIAGDDRGVRNA